VKFLEKFELHAGTTFGEIMNGKEGKFLKPVSIPKKNTQVIYVGCDRYSLLAQHAISVSFASGRQVSAAQFAKFLIDEFSGPCEERLLTAIQNDEI
jgi:hypothetical protein